MVCQGKKQMGVAKDTETRRKVQTHTHTHGSVEKPGEGENQRFKDFFGYEKM